MQFFVRFMAIIGLSLIIACDGSNSSNATDTNNGGTTGGGNAGTTPPTTNIQFDNTNAESLPIFVLSRLNIVLAEIFRNLERLNVEITDFDAVMAVASPSNIVAAFAPDYCDGDGGGGPTGAELLEFQDPDLSSTFNAGDRINFSYGSTNCVLSGSTDFAALPNEVGGNLNFTFDAGTNAPNAGPRTFSGTAEFLNYIYFNGLLAHVESEEETILSGTINFSVTFPNDGSNDSTATFNSLTDVMLDGRANPIGAITLRFPEDTLNTLDAIERVRTGTETTLTVRNTEVEVLVDLTTATIETIAYQAVNTELVAPILTLYPGTGGLQFNGANSSVQILASVAPALAIFRLDANGNGIYGENINEASETNDWDHMIMGFLIPFSPPPPP